MKAERLALYIINLLLGAFLAFAALVLMEQLPAMGWEWYSRSLRCVPLLLCFLAGLAARRVRLPKGALLAASCLAAGVAEYFIFPAHAPMDMAYIVLSLIPGALLYLVGLRGGTPFPPKLAVASILLYLFICAYFYLRSGESAPVIPLTWCALVSFLLSLYSFNAASLRSGVHAVKGGGEQIPSGMRSKNLALLTLFLLVALPVSCIGFIRRGLGGFVSLVIGGVWRILLTLAGGGDDSAGERAEPTPTPTVDMSSEPGGLPDIEGSGAAEIIITIFIGIMLLAALLLVIVLLAGSGGSSRDRRSLRGFFRRLFKTRETMDYEDSVERTMELKKFLRQKRRAAAELIKRLTVRPERLEDMPDARAKLRFAYRALLKSRRVNSRAVYCTPNELGAQLGGELREFTEAYSAARYNEAAAVPDSAGDVAARAMSALRK